VYTGENEADELNPFPQWAVIILYVEASPYVYRETYFKPTCIQGEIPHPAPMKEKLATKTNHSYPATRGAYRKKCRQLI
jgi:hypothetical protein